MGSTSVDTTIGATICRRWRRWLPVVLPLARTKSLKLRHYQPVCGRLRHFYSCVYRLDNFKAYIGHGIIQGSGSDVIIFTGGGPKGLCTSRYVVALCGGRRRWRLLPSKHACKRMFQLFIPIFLTSSPRWSRVYRLLRCVRAHKLLSEVPVTCEVC
jgi:hypothetical protein